MRSGVSGLGQGMGRTENRTMTCSYSITLFRDGYEAEFFPKSPLFVNKPATLSTKNDVICAVSLPQLNFYLEKGVRERGMRRGLNGRQKQMNYDDMFYSFTPDEFVKTWNFLGSLDEKPELAQNYSEGGIIKPALNPKIGVHMTGVVPLKQQFAEHVSSGDQLYWIVKSVESPYRCFFNPKGQTVGQKTPDNRSFLQVFGFSDKDTVTPVPSTAIADRDSPLLRDSMGLAKNIAIKQHYSRLDWDEDAETFVRLDTEDADVPDLVVDMWQQGHVIPVGVVQRADQKPVGRDDLLTSHRSYKKQMLLPNVYVSRA